MEYDEAKFGDLVNDTATKIRELLQSLGRTTDGLLLLEVYGLLVADIILHAEHPNAGLEGALNVVANGAHRAIMVSLSERGGETGGTIN